jgi:hypothetical protein
MAMAIQSRWRGSQKSEAPQTEQKPRLTVPDDWYQRTFSPPFTLTRSRGTSVEAKQWPDQARHRVQWQMSGDGSSPSTSKLTAPQRQAPLGIFLSSGNEWFERDLGRGGRAAKPACSAVVQLA